MKKGRRLTKEGDSQRKETHKGRRLTKEGDSKRKEAGWEEDSRA
jgi:hypothetical protein